jgi:hypothetical protein
MIYVHFLPYLCFVILYLYIRDIILVTLIRKRKGKLCIVEFAMPFYSYFTSMFPAVGRE